MRGCCTVGSAHLFVSEHSWSRVKLPLENLLTSRLVFARIEITEVSF